jgi:hypothetical protein
MKKNEHKLPLFYQQQESPQSSDSMLPSSKEERSLREFVVCCLLDPAFPSFVKKIEKVFNQVLNDELN